MKHQAKFSTKQEQVTQQHSEVEAREFAGSDELLRFDAAQTAVPPGLSERLQKSSEQIRPPSARPWWRAWLGR
jgi:hypothetical protein